jgi:hypothetical protein
VRILEYPTMLHAKAFVRDREEVLAGTCNLEAWSPRRFSRSTCECAPTALAAQFDERCWRYVARDSDLAEALLDGLARPV